MIGWDHPDTARYYEKFCAHHDRYRGANESLVWHAEIQPRNRVLDVGAGIGHTSEAILDWLSEEGRIVAYEPAAAMCSAGEVRVRDPRVQWVRHLPDDRFDRILCGASIWQILPLEEALKQLAARLGDGGSLSFNIPSMYLGEPDEPGGGGDPYLLALPARLGVVSTAPPANPLPSADAITQVLQESGLDVVSWRFRQPLRDTEYRDWLKIPVLTNQWFSGIAAEERARRLDCAFDSGTDGSWRWESWSGFTASKRATSPKALRSHQAFADSSALVGDTTALCSRADADGYLFFPGLLSAPEVESLGRRVEQLYRGRPDDMQFLELQRQVALLNEAHALLRSEPITEILRKLLGFDLEKDGHVCRAVPPGAAPTPPHQDEYFLRKSKRAWIVWIPLQDCPLRVGPLAVLPGSLHEGLHPHTQNRIMNLADSVCWATGPMHTGDVLMFDSHTIHCACPNLTTHTTRFSIDCRYASRA